jgi:RNA polymerase primary sigma factor
MTTSTCNLPSRTRPDPKNLRYVPDRRIRTQSASSNAERIAEWIRTGGGRDTKPDEHALFAALQTCAYRAARRAGRRPISERERSAWAGKWKVMREYLVQKNLGLAYAMVSRFHPLYAHEDDLVSEALSTLAKSVECFNPWKGFRFSTYACNAIFRSLVRCDQRERKYRRVFPVQHDVELDLPVPPPDPRPAANAERLNRALKRNTGNLTDLESNILGRRFPLERKPGLTLEEIGNLVGLSKERVRQIEKLALSKLRAALNEDPLFG